jgi:hypothetical protein
MMQFDKSMVVATGIDQMQTVIAAITTLYRLEVDPAGDGYDEALSARVADPLWMLARQWQFGELDGEDAGSPLEVRYRLEGTAVLGWAPGRDPAFDSFRALGDPALGAAPLEAQVEAEPVFAAKQPHRRALAEAGRMLSRLASDAGQPALADTVRGVFPLAMPAPADPPSDPAGLLWHLLLDERCIDAGQLVAALRPLRQADGTLAGLPPELLAAGVVAGAQPLFEQWLRWADDFVFEGDNAAWLPEHQEYAFELAAGRGAGDGARRFRLDAQEYVDGRIDWHDFDLAPADAATLMPGDAPVLDDAASRLSFATPVQYPGMPASRYWEFEDARVNFARIDAAKLDLVRMMVAEYALVHGNDWFMVPARLLAGGLYRVVAMNVTDTFGVVTEVAPVAADDGIAWRLQGLSSPNAAPGQDNADGAWLFLPPPLSDALEGDPLEEVAFARDEMANLVWAIEKRVQGTSGEPLDRSLEDQRYSIRQQPTLAMSSAPLLYRLMTAVPSHWLPLLPAREAGNLSLDIHLLRGAMKRFYRQDAEALAATPGLAEFLQRLRASGDFVEALTPVDPGRADDLAVFAFHPRGLLLRSDPAVNPAHEQPPLRIAEEEVGRDGVVVERRFQYARTADGRAVLWVGRSKRVGRGEASSGLRFDVQLRPGQL